MLAIRLRNPYLPYDLCQIVFVEVVCVDELCVVSCFLTYLLYLTNEEVAVAGAIAGAIFKVN